MSIVTLPLPVQLANGTIADANQVMTDLNYLAAQVNANAQPLSSTPTAVEWQPLGQAPTFIGATSFSVPGNLTATLAPGRRLQTTNTGGTIYSTIATSVFAAVTTVTVVNDAGVLDAGLSAVNYGILNQTPSSVPIGTIIQATGGGGALSSTVDFVLCSVANTGVIQIDTLAEFSATTGVATVKNSGYYLCSASAEYIPAGITATVANLVLEHNSAAVYGATFMSHAGMLSNVGVAPANLCQIVKCNATDTLRFVSNWTFSAGGATATKTSILFVRIF